MKLKGRSILVICLIIFGSYALFDFYQDKAKSEKSMEESRVMTLNFEQVNDILIQKGSEKIHLKRDVDGWKLEEPLKDNADNEAADDLVKSIFTERVIDVAKEGEGIDWKLFGLDAPLGTITLTTTEGKKNIFEIGTMKNFEDNVFARRDGENKVLLINSIWQNRVEKKAIEFRDRRFLRHKIASVDDVQLKNSRGLLHLKRTDGKWAVVDKPALQIDQNKVRALLTSFADAKAAEILEKSQEPKGVSLFTLNLTMDSKPWSAKVVQAMDKKIYANVTEPNFLLKMEPGALDKLIDMRAEDLQVEKEKPLPKEPTEKKEQ